MGSVCSPHSILFTKDMVTVRMKVRASTSFSLSSVIFLPLLVLFLDPGVCVDYQRNSTSQ